MLLVRRSLASLRAAVPMSFLILATTATVVGQTPSLFPGGWVEKQGTFARPRYTAAQIQSFVPPTRGTFTFPTPYNTQAIRITDASDCGGQDCVNYIGYSYWRNTNAHESSNSMWIVLGLSSARGGAGPTLFKLDKATDAVTKIGPLFPAGSQFISNSGEGWYFSASRPNKLYVNAGPKMLRYDVVSHLFDTVFDITTQFGNDRYIWQMHSSSDDLVHSATLRVTSTGADLGCLVFNETTKLFSFFAKQGTYDECQIDMSGRFLIIKQEMNGNQIMDNLYVDLQTGVQRTMYDAMGHSDMGFGYIVGPDPWNSLPNAEISYQFTPTFLNKGPAMFYNINWNTSVVLHPSHQNAKSGVAMNLQFACGSNADRSSIQNEITCFRLDTSYDQLVVAPIMTNLDAVGGCCAGDYSKLPKGNLDISGKYFIWTSNLGGNRLDAFLVKVPS